MGMRGPVPKRSEDRVRRNKDTLATTKAAGAKKVSIPRCDSSWHPIAKRWYNSLKRSGQSASYEPSDWAYACLLAYELTVLLEEPKVRAAALQTIMAGMNDLLTTEGARRRMRLELERGETSGVENNVVDITDYAAFYG